MLVAASFAFTITREARGIEAFPGIIQEHMGPGMTCAPACTLCHTSPAGGRDPGDLRDAQPGFFNNLITQNGGRFPEESTLTAYLDELETKACIVQGDPNFMTGPCDFDGDGTGDIAELRVSSDPTQTGEGNLGFCPQYGCGARIAPARRERPLDATGLALALGVALMLVRRARR